jgi:hypothetical protein
MAQQSWLHRRHACGTLDSKYMERRFSGRCGGSKERSAARKIDARRINVNAAEGDGFATRVGQRANRVQR